MKYRDIFPYQNRRLGLQSFKTPKEVYMDWAQLARIAMANLEPGDELVFAKGSVVVLKIDDASVTYRFQTLEGQVGELTDQADAFEQGSLFKAMVVTLPGCAPEYVHPLCQVVERDPAVYRLQTQLGWVANDEMALYSGNVIPVFPKRKTPSTDLDPKEDRVDPTHKNETDPGGQGSFGF